MPDPFAHDDLTSSQTRREAYRISAAFAEAVQDMEVVAVSAALVALLQTIFTREKMDFDHALDQLRDAFDSGDMSITPFEIAEIDANLELNLN